MNAYVDLSYIGHVITLLNVPYYFKRIFNIKFSKWHFIIMIIVSLLMYFNVFIYMEYQYMNCLVLLGLFFLLYKKHVLKILLLFCFIYYGNLATCMLFTNKLYLYHGVIFIDHPTGFNYLLVQFINILIIEIVMLSIRSIKLFKNFRIKVNLKLEGKFHSFTGYIDSGNTLMHEGRPVIFLQEKYFVNNNFKEMMVTGIGKRN